MKILNFCLLGSLMVLFYGCATEESVENSRRQVMQRVEQESQKNFKYTEDRVNSLSNSVDLLTKTCNNLDERVRALEARASDLQRQNLSQSQTTQKLASENENLRKLLSKEQDTRQQSLNKMAEQMAKETASALNAANEANAKQLASLRAAQEQKEKASAAAAVPSGTYYEYTVQPGATLSAIAKAYKVSVAEIKAANKLKNDNVRVGQKLLIPKK